MRYFQLNAKLYFSVVSSDASRSFLSNTSLDTAESRCNSKKSYLWELITSLFIIILFFISFH